MPEKKMQGAKKIPIYMRLYEEIRESILRGERKPHDRLPSKRDLAIYRNVSVKTVENAYHQLELEGYIYAKEKSGFYVENIEDYRHAEYRGEPAKEPIFAKPSEEGEAKVDFRSNKNPAAEFPLATWKRLARETLSEMGPEMTEPLPFQGSGILRMEIAKFLHNQRGMEVSPEQIIIGSGTEYLYSRLIQILHPGTVFAMEDPGYSHIRKIYQSNKVPYLSIPMDEQGVLPTLLEESGADILHISPAYQFPLGIVMPINRRVELLEWVNKKPGRYIIEDDYNCEYRYQGNLVPTIFSISIRPRVIYMNTFSKTVMPSLRISYMVLPDELMERYVNTRSFYACTSSALEQITLAKFMNRGYLERYINHIKHLNIAQRKMVARKVRESRLGDRLALYSELAGTHYLLWINTVHTDQEITAQLAEKGVQIASVSEYMEKDDQKYRNLFIINYSRAREVDMDYFLECLEKIEGV